ncbi:MAG: hypothetical protein QNK03_18235 [Myxococcota bacterium]|nr:hypothetical protein [Myxococcota bacterium]
MSDDARRDGAAGLSAGALGRAILERGLLPFVREPTLWPVGLVLLAHAWAFLAPLMLFATRDGKPLAAALLVLAALPTLAALRWEWRERGRPAVLSAVAAATWLGSAVAALAAGHYEVL